MKRLSAMVMAAALAAVTAAAAPTPPPLNIAANNVTGTHGPEGDLVLLNGNVRITRAKTVITADRGRYIRNRGMLFLDGQVRLRDTTTTLTCDHASYDENQDLLEVSGNVVVEDREATLRAPSGTYDRASGRADLYGGVTAEEKAQIITADRLTYQREDQQVKARGHVRAEDRDNRLVLKGDAVDYDRVTKEAVATGNPLLESRDDKNQITEVRAVRLQLNTESRVAEAHDSVLVVRDTLQVRADYALFDDRADRGILLGHPRATDNQTTVTADTLEVWTEKRRLQRFVARGEPAIDYRGALPTTRGETSRLTGNRIEVFFTDQDIDSLVALGEASNEYQAAPRPGKTAEGNRAEGDTITVFFRDRKIDRALVTGRASGAYMFAVDQGDTAAAQTEIVRYDARRIEFQVPRDKIVLEPRAHLVYKELELHARRVEFDSERQTLVAAGDPQLVDRGDKVTGHLMTYDLESRAGTIYQAATSYEKGLYHGEQIRKVGDDVLNVKQGSYSTCDLPEPHYHFQSRWMKIFIKDKLVARPVVFYIRNVPLLALPFAVFPIKPGRHSGFLFPQFELGFNNRAGQFLRNAGYYWAPNDYMDFTASGDYYQADPSWVLRGEGVYRLLYRLDGRFNGTFAHNDLLETDDYDFTASHTQSVTPRTGLSAQASFISNRAYGRSDSYGRPLSQRLQRFLNSSLSFSHNADWASVNVVADRRQDLDADQGINDPDGLGPLRGPPPGTSAPLPNLTSLAPSLGISFPTRTIGKLRLLRGSFLEKPLSAMYFSANARYLSFYTRTAFVERTLPFAVDSVTFDTTTVVGQRELTRRAAATNVSLSDARRLFGWINFAPSLNANGVVFDFDNLGNRMVPTGTWSAALGTGTTLYGTSRARIGPVVGMRHVIAPSIAFGYSPEFRSLTYLDSLGVRRDRFSGFGGIGVSGFKSSAMSFGLGHRFQFKVRQGDKVVRYDNLLSLNTNGSYDFLYRERGGTRGLSNLSSILRLQPPTGISADLAWITDPYASKPIRSMAATASTSLRGKSALAAQMAQGEGTGVAPDLPLDRRVELAEETLGDPWSLSLAYSYAAGQGIEGWETTHQIANGVAQINLTRNWRLDYSASYSLQEGQVLTQRFGLTRDLHCWHASFTRTFIVGGEAEYYFRIGVKEQKEIYIERGTRTGSIGGIQ